MSAASDPAFWSEADDAALLQQQLVERAALDLVLGDAVQAAAYLALVPPSRHLAMTFGEAVLAAERKRDSQTDY